MNKPNKTIMIEDYIKTIETVSTHLKETGEITLNEYNEYNIIKRKINELQEELSNNNHQNKFQYDLQLSKIRVLLEKMQTDIQNKKEYEFISNYFISQNCSGSLLDLSVSTNDNSRNKDTLGNDVLYPEFTEQSLSELNSINLDSFNSLGDILKVTSQSFLSHKANFSDDVINKIKGNNGESNSNGNTIVSNKQNNQSNEIAFMKKKSKKKLLPELNKAKKSTSPGVTNQNPNDKIDKEIEEEINNQIFKYTKSIKENARAFNSKLKQDNKTLNSIEDIQIKDKDKTDTEYKKLKEFNYTLSIGFCRLIMMFISAIVIFIFTLLIMRIFPKFA